MSVEHAHTTILIDDLGHRFAAVLLHRTRKGRLLHGDTVGCQGPVQMEHNRLSPANIRGIGATGCISGESHGELRRPDDSLL